MTAALAGLWERLTVRARRLRADVFRAGRFAFRLFRAEDGRPIRRPALVLRGEAGPRALGDALNRVAWYFGSTPGEGPGETEITAYVPRSLLEARPEVPEEQRDVLERAPPIRRRPREELRRADHDLLLVRSSRDLLHPKILPSLARVRLVDESFYSGQATTEFAVAMDLVADGDARRDSGGLFRSNFRRLLERGVRRSRSAALGTGPSLDEIFEVDLSDTSVIVCNSIVKNERLLEHLDPVAVCFGDPVFHFGPSEYAARFREDLVRVVDRHDCFAVTHAREARLLLRHYPELRDRLVGLEADVRSWAVPSPESMRVRPTTNVLTLFMLPLAAALSDEVLIGGCDGREPGEDYFWKHNSSVQYEGLMRTVFESHPAFFRDRIYSDYYEEHCRQLEDQISTWEEEGMKFRNVTHSFIPALARRSAAD